MTVGQHLAEKTGLKLFHNHMTIEGICDLFANYSAERKRLTCLFREEVFRAFAKTEEYGLIFTYMCAFEMPEEWEYLAHVEEIFAGAEIYYVELQADMDVRLERNRTENRLLHKPSKRDLETSERRFRSLEERYRLNSLPGETISKEHYLKIDNTHLDPDTVAEQIKQTFGLS